MSLQPCHNGFFVIQRGRCALPCGEEDRRGFIRCYLRGNQPAQQPAGGYQVCESMPSLDEPRILGFDPTRGIRFTDDTLAFRNRGRAMRRSYGMNTAPTKSLSAAVSCIIPLSCLAVQLLTAALQPVSPMSTTSVKRVYTIYWSSIS